MAQLIVRNVTRQIVLALKQRAAANGRSAEGEHREILHKTLLEGTGISFPEPVSCEIGFDLAWTVPRPYGHTESATAQPDQPEPQSHD